MPHSPHFPPHLPGSAPAKSRPLMEASRKQLGFLPDAVARLAESPLTLASLFQGFATFKSTSLSPLEQEVVVMTVARENDCHLCVAMHSAQLSSMEAPAGLLEALRSGAPLHDERPEALAAFTRSVLHRKGAASQETLERFLAVGFTRAQALEVVLGVSAYTLSTYANRLVGAQVDPPLAPFAPAA